MQQKDHYRDTGQKLFGKPLAGVTLEDIETFFSLQQEETSQLEFKSGEVSVPSILKEITAFLNADGGLIIIGAPREKSVVKSGEEVKLCVGALDLCRTMDGPRAILEQMQSSIVPKPDGVSIYELRGSDGAVFLIDVPKSDAAPHQISGEGRYYIRSGTNAVPAPHEVVEALFSRKQWPVLNVTAEMRMDGAGSRFVMTLSNQSRFLAEKPGWLIELFGTGNASDERGAFKRHPSANRFGCVLTSCIEHSGSLPQHLEMRYEATIVHTGNPFVVKIAYWCNGADTRFAFFEYDHSRQSLRRFNTKQIEDILELQALIGDREELFSLSRSVLRKGQ